MMPILKYMLSLKKERSYDIATLPALSNAIIDKFGNIFIGTTQGIEKSTDKGVTFTPVKYFNQSIIRFRGSFIDKNNNIYFSPYSTSIYDTGLWRSYNGVNFSRVIELGAQETFWGIDEDSYGNIYAGTYSLGSNKAELHKSTDKGLTFSIIKSWTATHRHIHNLRVVNDIIYVCLGDNYDTEQNYKSIDGGSTFTVIPNLLVQMTDVDGYDGFRIFGTDEQFYGRIYRTTDDTTHTVVLDTHYQNLFFFRVNPTTGNIYAGFKLDPSASAGPDWPATNYAELYKSTDLGINWSLVSTLEDLTAGDGFWFASNFYKNNLIVSRLVNGVWIAPLIIKDE